MHGHSGAFVDLIAMERRRGAEKRSCYLDDLDMKREVWSQCGQRTEQRACGIKTRRKRRRDSQVVFIASRAGPIR